MMRLEREDLVGAAWIAAALTALAMVVALAVRLAAADEVRQMLHFTFPGVPARFGEVGAIFANNMRVFLSVVAASGVAQAAIRVGGSGPEHVLATSLRALCDLALLLGCALQVAIVGAALGAYGGRCLWPILPHLPFELGAFSLGLSLYLEARRERVELARLLTVSAMGLSLLAAGAFVEVYA
jgi:hypothetical protein